MRTHYLPESQDKRNKAVLARLGWIGVWQVLLGVGIVGAGLWIYAKPPLARQVAHVVSTDGATDYGEALFVGPDSVVCLGIVPGSAVVDLNGDHITAVKIGSATIGDSRISLLQLQGTLSSDINVNPVLAHIGNRVTSLSGGSGWDGTVTDVQQAEYVVEPPFSLGPGVGVFAKDDVTSLIGMSVESKGRTIVVPIAGVMSALKQSIPK
jgi:hypothetical protein